MTSADDVVRHLHFVWGGPLMSEHLRQNLIAWRDMHPEWDVTLWGDDDLGWLQHRDLFDAAPSLVPADAVWQLRSDIARYEILLKHGGLYVDVDTHPLRPVDDALEGHSIWAAREDKLHVGNTYLYSWPHHPLMQAIVDGLRDSIRRNRGKRPNWMTGPRYLTPLWRQHGAYAAPPRDWFPISYSDARQGREPDIPDSAYAVHSWHHLRTLQKAGKR